MLNCNHRLRHPLKYLLFILQYIPVRIAYRTEMMGLIGAGNNPYG
jgi:hypothetical protein